MPEITIVNIIAAPIELCFDCARDIDLHIETFAHTGERAVAGRTSGLIELGETVTWEGRHLGVKQRLTSKITAFEAPTYFQDCMVQGAFKSFCHDHYFKEENGKTQMTDRVIYSAPLGLLGKLADFLFLKRYIIVKSFNR